MTVSFPAKLMLVAAMNPCPCGYLTDPTRLCWCTPTAVHHYRNQISGPLLDRIDIQVDVPGVPCRDLMTAAVSESSAAIRARVIRARGIQLERFSKLPGVRCNAQMPTAVAQRTCRLRSSEQTILENAVKRLGFSARAFIRILKVARTIADLGHSEEIQTQHLAEAIQYRSLDRPLLASQPVKQRGVEGA